MATENLTDTHKVSNQAGSRAIATLKRVVNTATDNKAQNDVDQLFDVLAGDVVLNVAANVVTAEGGTLTFDVGDGDDADGFIDGANGNSAGWNTQLHAATASTGATPVITMTGYTGGKVYAADDTIDVTWLNAADAAKVEFFATVLRLG